MEALEEREKQAAKRMEKLMNEKTGVSIMDFKQQFGWIDRELGRGRLLQEIGELRATESKGAKRND